MDAEEKIIDNLLKEDSDCNSLVLNPQIKEHSFDELLETSF